MNLFKYLFLYAITIAMVACENEKNTFNDQPAIYLRGDASQNATSDSVFFSFKKYDETVTDYDLNLMVYATGVPAEEARTFELQVVADETNVSPDDYILGKMEMPAKAYHATVPITVKRQVANVDLTSQNASLTIRVKSNENFEEGPDEYAEYKLVWCNYLIQPAWWTSNFASYTGPYTEARYTFILNYYGDVDMFEMGIVDPDTEKVINTNKLYAFVTELIDLLKEYNTTHDTPYMNDDGNPLAFGSGLSN